MYEYKAKVTRVVDGDTVDFEVDLGFHIKADIRGRLKGVDTPERGHADFLYATKECSKLLRSAGTLTDSNELYVIIKTKKTGKYGRWIVEIDGVTDKLSEKWPYE